MSDIQSLALIERVGQMTENLIVFGIFSIIPIIWGVTVYQSHRLYSRFLCKYPVIAIKEIPYAFTHWTHPKKALFFFTNRAINLIRNDAILWKEWKRFAFLSFASIGLPFFIGLIGSVFALCCILYERTHP